MTEIPVCLLPAGGFVLFFIFWNAVCFLLSRMSGWNELAERYSGARNFSGKRWFMKSARIGMVNYNSCLVVGLGEGRLFLSVIFFFRFGHRSILAPLENVRGTEKKGILFKYVDLDFSGVPGVRVRIGRSLAETISSESGGAWNYERLAK